MIDDIADRLEFRIDPDGEIIGIDRAEGAMAPLLLAVDNIAYLVGVHLSGELMHQCIVNGRASGLFVCEATWIPQAGRCTMVMNPGGHQIACVVISAPQEHAPMLPQSASSIPVGEWRG